MFMRPHCLFALILVSGQRVTSPDSIAQDLRELDKDVKDYITEIPIESTQSNRELNEQMEPIDDLDRKARDLVTSTQQQTSTIEGALRTMTEQTRAAVDEARTTTKKQVKGSAEVARMERDVANIKEHSVNNMKLQKDLSVEGDKALFEVLHRNAQRYSQDVKDDVARMLERENMKMTATSTGFDNKLSSYNRRTSRWSSTMKQKVKEGNEKEKELEDTLDAFHKKVEKKAKATTKFLAKMSKKIPKTFGTKKFMKANAKALKGLKTLSKKQFKAVAGDTKKKMKKVTKGFKDLDKSIVKRGDTYAKELKKLEEKAGKETEDLKEETREMGADMRLLSAQIKDTTRSVRDDKRSMEKKIKGARRAMKSNLRTFQQEARKTARLRVPSAKTYLDGEQAKVEGVIGKSARDTEKIMVDSIDDMDNKVQESIYNVYTPMQEAESNVKAAKTGNTKYSSDQADEDVELGIEADRGIRTVKDATDTEKDAAHVVGMEVNTVDASLKAKQEAYERKATQQLQELSDLVDTLIADNIETPVESATKKGIRNLQTALSGAKEQQTERFEQLETQLTSIRDILATTREGNQHVDVKIPEMLKSIGVQTDELEFEFKTLRELKERLKPRFKSVVDTSVKTAENEVTKKLLAISEKQEEKLTNRKRGHSSSISEILNKFNSVTNDNIDLTASVKDQHDRIKARIGHLHEAVTDAQFKRDERVLGIKNDVSLVKNEMLPALERENKNAVANAKETLDKLMADEKKKRLAKWNELVNMMEKKVAAKYEAGDKQVTDTYNDFETRFESSDEALDKSLNEIEARQRDVNGKVAAADVDVKTWSDDSKRLADDVTKEGDNVIKSLGNFERTATDEMKAMAAGRGTSGSYMGRNSQDSAQVLQMYSLDNAAERKSVEHDMGEMRAALGEGAKEFQAGQESSGQGMNEAQVAARRAVELGQEGAAAANAAMHEQYQAFQRSGVEIDNAAKNAGSNAAYATDKLGAEAKDQAATEQTIAMALHATDGDNYKQFSEARDREMAKVLSAAEQAQATMGADGVIVNSESTNAKTALENDEDALKRVQDWLWYESSVLEEQLQTFDALNKEQVELFEKELGDESETLDKRIKDLDRYERFDHWRALDTTSAIVTLLATQHKAAKAAFAKVAADSQKFAGHIEMTMNSDAYRGLKLIYDADKWVNRATTEDAMLVDRMNAHEAKTLPWMQKVLVALSTSHDEMLDAEAGRVDMAKTMFEKSEKTAAKVVDNLMGSVDAMGNGTNGGDQASQLLNDLKGGSETEKYLDTEASNTLEQENTDAQQSASNRMLSVMSRLGTTTQLIQHSEESLAKMEQTVEKAKKHVEFIAKTKSNQMRQSAEDMMQGFATGGLPGAESFVEIGEGMGAVPAHLLAERPRLQSLLEENAALTKHHQRLDERHSSLGAQIEKVAQLSRFLQNATDEQL